MKDEVNTFYAYMVLGKKMDTLRRIDHAIERLCNITGPYIDPVSVLQSIQRLEKKRLLVEEDNYVIHKINAEAVGVVGVLICENVKSREPWYNKNRTKER